MPTTDQGDKAFPGSPQQESGLSQDLNRIYFTIKEKIDIYIESNQKFLKG